MQSDDDQWICPSFNSYSQNKLAEIASKVSKEGDKDVRSNETTLPSTAENFYENLEDDDEEEDGFEFSLVPKDEFEAPENGLIYGLASQHLIFPVFNRDLLKSEDREENSENSWARSNIPSCSNLDPEFEQLGPSDTLKVPLSQLFREERREDEEARSSSSSEADEVEAIPPGRYCVWKLKGAAAPPSPSTCNKSKSTGFGSKRWKLRDLLRRSNSEGKESFIFLSPKRKEEKQESKKNSSNASKVKKSTTTTSSPNHRMLYESPNRSPKLTKGNNMPKRKSYLPYRQDLVGFFTTVNSIGRNFSPL